MLPLHYQWYGGSSRIRTYSAMKQQIYSLPRLSNFGVLPDFMSYQSFVWWTHFPVFKKKRSVFIECWIKDLLRSTAFFFLNKGLLRWLWDSNPLSLRNGFADRPDSSTSANHQVISSQWSFINDLPVFILTFTSCHFYKKNKACLHFLVWCKNFCAWQTLFLPKIL
jgi:hypothetical protein